MDFSKHLNRILEIDPTARNASVEPGVILDHLRQQAEKYGLTFGPDPASHSRCTLGGMIGNNSCGVHAVAWGKTVDNIESLDTATGQFCCTTLWETASDEQNYGKGLFQEVAAKLGPLMQGAPTVQTLPVENSSAHRVEAGKVAA